MSRADSFLGFIFGSDELLLVSVVVFLLFAGRKLPQMGRGLRIGLHEFRAALRQMDRGAHDAGRSAGGVFGKPAHEALTPDNHTAELYDPAVFDRARTERPSFIPALWFRTVPILPAGLGLLALAMAVMVTLSSLRQSEWGFLAFAGLLALLAAILFRCAHRVWRQTSASSVRELCGWVTFTSMALVSFIVERLAASGRNGLAWLVALASIPVLVVIYRTLSRLLLAGLSVLERDLREKLMPAALPFQISPEAEAHIRERLHAPPGLRVALVRTLGYEERNPNGRVIMRFPHEFLTVGYYESGERPTALQVEMFGATVSIIPDTLERLRGRTLTVHTGVYRHGWFGRTRRKFLIASPVEGDRL